MQETEKKKTNFKLIAIIFLLVGLGLLVTSIVINKINSNPKEKNDQTNKNNSTENIRELTKTETEILREKMEVISQYFGEYYPLESIDSISNQTLLQRMRIISKVEFSSFSATDLDSTMIKYFGNSKKLIHEDILCAYKNHETLYLYDANNNNYNYNENHGGHGGSGFISKVKVYDVAGMIKDEKTVTVMAKILYGNYCSDICISGYSYYTNYPTNDATPILSSTEAEEYIITDEKYNEIVDLIPVTTFIFKKESDGNYTLKKVSL